MTVESVTAILLIIVPIAFNVAFIGLGRAFDYPDILRKEPDEILRRFDAGGAGLILRWEALLLSALAMLPLSALLAVVLGAPAGLSVLAVVVGAGAALVQSLGLVRWPFAVPELARRYIAAPSGPEGDATRETVEVVFATLHRLLGVGIGEHLGYLLTGVWTLLVAASILSTTVLPAWLGIVGLPIGIALLDRHPRVRGTQRARRLAPRRDHRAHRLHRLVDLAHRARRVPAGLTAMADRRHGFPPPPTTSRFDAAAWADAPLSGTQHEAVLFAEVDFTDILERGASFVDCTFREVRFSGSSHIDAAFTNCTFVECTLFDTRFTRCKLVGSRFDGCTYAAPRGRRRRLVARGAARRRPAQGDVQRCPDARGRPDRRPIR